MPISEGDIRKAFAALASELDRRRHRAELVVAGGAAIVLLFGARKSTKDVDAVFLTSDTSIIRDAAKEVAQEMNLPEDWLNDGAKGYFVGVSSGEILFSSPSLNVRAASVPQLLAMKLAAWRDAVDRSDARLLLQHLQGSKEQIWSSVMPFVAQHQLDKASYAFDDLWEAAYGTC